MTYYKCTPRINNMNWHEWGPMKRMETTKCSGLARVSHIPCDVVWASAGRLKSPAYRDFVQQLVHICSNKTSNLHLASLLWGGSKVRASNADTVSLPWGHHERLDRPSLPLTIKDGTILINPEAPVLLSDVMRLLVLPVLNEGVW